MVRWLICKTVRMGRAGSPLHHTSVRRVRSFTLPRDYNCKSVHSSFFRLHSCCLPGPAHVTRPSPHYRHYPPGHTTHYSAMTPANGSTDLKNGSPSPRIKGQSNKRVCVEARVTGHGRESLVQVWSKGVCPVAVEGWTPPSLSWDSRPWVGSSRGEGGVQVGGGGCPCHCVPLGCPGVAETHLRDAPATLPHPLYISKNMMSFSIRMVIIKPLVIKIVMLINNVGDRYINEVMVMVMMG